MPDRPDFDGSHIEKLAVTLDRLTVPNLPAIHQIRLFGGEATYIKASDSVETAASYQVEVEVSEADLCAFVRKQLPERLRLRDLRITEAGIELSADAMIIVPIPVRVSLRLAILHESEIHVVADDVNVLGAGPKQLVSSQLQLLNPLIRTRDLPVSMRFTEVCHLPTKLIVVGLLEKSITLSKFVI